MIEISNRKGTAEVLLYGEIGSDGLSAKAFKEALDQAAKGNNQVTLRINSPGGNVFDGVSMFHTARRLGHRLTTEVDGLAASAASIVAMAGHIRNISQGGFIMIHNPYMMLVGDAKALRTQADLLDKVKNEIVQIYTSRTGANSETVSQWMDNETWMNADDAVSAKFMDGTNNIAIQNLCIPSHLQYRNVPNFKAQPSYWASRIQKLQPLKGKN